MAFPAAPTESGGSKLHFLLSNAETAELWLSVADYTTDTGSNSVGMAGIATHIDGQLLTEPGGVAAGSIPMVLVGGDAGTTAKPFQVDASSFLKVVLQAGTAEFGALSTGTNAIGSVTLGAGTNAIGKLAANSGVDIGDVDVTSVITGTAASNLGKAEDAQHASGDVGVMMLGVENADQAALSAGDKDYTPIAVTAEGNVLVEAVASSFPVQEDGAALTALQLIDDPVQVLGTDTYTETTSKGMTLGAVRRDADTTLVGTTNEFGPLQMDANGRLKVEIFDGGGTHTVDNNGTFVTQVDGAALTALQLIDNIVVVEDAVHGSGDSGVMALAVRQDSVSVLAADADYIPLSVQATGYLRCSIINDTGTIAVSGTVTASDTAGDRAHDATDSGNPVKIGGRAQEPTAQPDEVADNDRVDALYDRNGYLHVRGDMNPLNAAFNGVNTSGNNEIVAAQANKKIAVWAVLLIAEGTVETRWEDGADAASGTFTGQMSLQAREGYASSAGGLVPLWVGSSNVALNLELNATVQCSGFVSYTVIDD